MAIVCVFNDCSHMMTSPNGDIFRVTGPLCGEFTSPGEFHAQRPVTRSFDVFFDLRLNKRLSKQPWGWWFEMSSCSLWSYCNDHAKFATGRQIAVWRIKQIAKGAPVIWLCTSLWWQHLVLGSLINNNIHWPISFPLKKQYEQPGNCTLACCAIVVLVLVSHRHG